MSVAEPGDDDPPPNAAAAASNWWVVLLADGALGVAALALGVALVLVWGNVLVGAGIASLGLGYALVVWRRGRLWSQWRRRAGLGG